MLEQLPRQLQPFQGVDHLLNGVDQVITTAPEYHPNPDERILFPLSALFAPLSLTPAGQSAFRHPEFSTALRGALTAWCAFLDSPQSRQVLTETGNGWLTPQAAEQNRLHEYVIPDRDAEHWGFTSFNDYFHRRIRPEARPVATNPKAVVAPGDGTVLRVDRNIGKKAVLPLKGRPYALAEMFNHHAYTDQFIGGSAVQIVVPGTGYHRWHAPVDGVVRHVETVPGHAFSLAHPTGPVPTAQEFSLTTEAASNTRGLIFIESSDPTVGLVCLMPIGMSEVSSITITASQGQQVKKGDELGYFSYGGSTHVMVFRPETKLTFSDSDGGDVSANGQLFQTG
ncbi:phosphatidylserine decarboxylase family protein [Kitasatospora kifunensis]|uniref:Phosphatidylserine decarboxylase n=1 Tax=Kitasatospora kifunensis TaxID=58351 RepID=A0A7W7R9P6_KITKI|nr:phosphatidylserine decarboxylase family protein [Kitasatospora kifunensis]MBB4927668.1 phosphatidylserine decarboxylase [Kitasatospora kifunensis]